MVDYHPGEVFNSADREIGIVRKVSKVLDDFRYSAPFKEKVRFIQYKKNCSKNYYPYFGIFDECVYALELDVLVIGSDEFFNCVQNNTNVGFSPELFSQGHRANRLMRMAFNIKEKRGDEYA